MEKRRTEKRKRLDEDAVGAREEYRKYFKYVEPLFDTHLQPFQWIKLFGMTGVASIKSDDLLRIIIDYIPEEKWCIVHYVDYSDYGSMLSVVQTCNSRKSASEYFDRELLPLMIEVKAMTTCKCDGIRLGEFKQWVIDFRSPLSYESKDWLEIPFVGTKLIQPSTAALALLEIRDALHRYDVHIAADAEAIFKDQDSETSYLWICVSKSELEKIIKLVGAREPNEDYAACVCTEENHIVHTLKVRTSQVQKIGITLNWCYEEAEKHEFFIVNMPRNQIQDVSNFTRYWR
jgi:hypothetical protein